jgi:YD repeat-containing protein
MRTGIFGFAMRRLAISSSPLITNHGNVASIQTPEANTTQFQYEATYSRLTQITDAMTPANVTLFAYPSLTQTTITNPLGKVTTITFSGAGQPCR